MASLTHIKPLRSEYLPERSFPQVPTPEQYQLTLLKTHSDCYQILENVSRTPPFKSDEARSLLERVENTKNSILEFNLKTAHNRTLRALDLASDPIPSKRSLDQDLVVDTLIKSFRKLSSQYLESDQTTPLLDHNSKNVITKKFSPLSLEIDVANHLLLYEAAEEVVVEAFSCLSTPLSTLVEISRTLFPEGQTFSLPTKTFLFFLHTLKRSPHKRTPKHFPKGTFSRIRSFTLGAESFVLKSTSNTPSIELLEDQKRQLKVEACVYMAFINTYNPYILELKAYSQKGLYLEVGGVDFFDFLAAPAFLNIPSKELPSTLRCFFYQIATSLLSLYKVGLLHGDLKPENILVVKNGSQTILKLCDFGFASRLGTSKDLLEGTFDYASPSQLCLFDEALADPEKSVPLPPSKPHTDCWAFGVMMYLYISGNHPFDVMKFPKKDLLSAAAILHKEAPDLPHAILEKEAFELCKRTYIKSLLDCPSRIQDLFRNLPQSMERTIRTRDPSGFFKELILRCLDSNDATRITMDEILAILGSRNYPAIYH